jgi:hypothetical protein
MSDDILDRIRAAVMAAEEEPTKARAIATFLRQLPVAEGEHFHNTLMTPAAMNGLANVVADLDPNRPAGRPTPPPRGRSPV